MAKPWLTSDDLIESVTRKIAAPISNITFTNDDVLRFINEEFAISLVPSVLSMHEEYFVTTKVVPLVSRQGRYPIPDRAIGMKLRDLFWQDQSGNLFQMSQITEEDKAFFQRSIGANQAIHKYYVEGNDVVLTPNPNTNPTGYLVFVFFLRPNQLVRNSRAATITGFSQTITVTASSISAGDTIIINGTTLTAVAGSPGANEFQIDASNIVTAGNLATAISANIGISASNGSPSTNVVKMVYSNLSMEITSQSSGLVLPQTQGIEFSSIPENITNSSYVDFLQTKPGHKIRSYDVLIPSNGISSTTITFTATDVPEDLVVGDYVCSQNECIIPQVPPDLHNGLAERASARMLASMGDAQGLQIANEKIADIVKSEGTLLDNRVDGSPRKITNKFSLLRWGRIGTRRRF